MVTGRLTLFGNCCAKVEELKEEKKSDLLIAHYTKANAQIALTRLCSNLKTGYLDKYPEVTSYPSINSFLSYVPMAASIFQLRTNQPYAKKAWELASYALIYMNVEYQHMNYYVLTCMEKLLSLYLSQSSTEVSGFVKSTFKDILNVDLPIDVAEFNAIKTTLFKRLNIEDKEPEIKVSEQLIEKLSKLSPDEYHQAQLTWKGVASLSDQPRPSL